jgi:DNA-binding beta-propeller fold protein YncE
LRANSSWKPRKPVAALLLVAAVFTQAALFSCAHLPQAANEAAPAGSWPRISPRIAWSAQIGSAKDLGIGAGFWGALWQTISGTEPERIGRPYGVHADERKRILVVDPQKRGVHLFDRSQQSYAFIGSSEDAVFYLPIGVTEDDRNVAYVTDAAAGTVLRFDLGLRRPAVFVAGLARPTGIAFSPTNRLLYVSETLAGQVVAFDLSGKEVLRFGKPGDGGGQFNHPTDLAVDSRGSVYVTDVINARVQVFSGAGVFQRMFGEAGDTPGYFNKPKGVAVNSNGEIFVCDALSDTVQVFNQEGRALFAFGSTGSGQGNFWMPSGMAIDREDNVYVADTYNNRIQVFSYVRLDQ